MTQSLVVKLVTKQDMVYMYHSVNYFSDRTSIVKSKLDTDQNPEKYFCHENFRHPQNKTIDSHW